MICKGSYVLGSACGGCSRCAEEWKRIRADGWRLISPNIEIMDTSTAMSRDKIEANADLVQWCVHVLGPDDMCPAPSHACADCEGIARRIIGIARGLRETGAVRSVPYLVAGDELFHGDLAMHDPQTGTLVKWDEKEAAEIAGSVGEWIPRGSQVERRPTFGRPGEATLLYQRVPR